MADIPTVHGVNCPCMYQTEENRLNSFHSWENAHLSGEELAKAGFFYLGEEDRVQCAFCKTTIGDWEAGDDALAEHRRLSPACFFADEAQANTGSPDQTVDGANTEGGEEEITSTPDGGVFFMEEHEPKEEANDSDTRRRELLEEKEELEYKLRCKICLSAEICTILRPCNHLCLCSECADRLDDCPICRQEITDRVRAYLS